MHPSAALLGMLLAAGAPAPPAASPARTALAVPLLVLAQPGGPGAAPTPRTDAGAQNRPMDGEITPELDAAVTKGLKALASLQNADGSFGSGRYSRNVAVTSLACLAFMADGHLPGRGEYGGVVLKGLEYVLSCCTETGLIAGDSTNGPMYGHGFATLFLGELYGMTQAGGETPLAERTHEALVRACRLIERSQNEEGGWRYNPVPYDADTSVTICQIMGLRAARNAGIEVPKSVIDRAVEYIRKCQNPDGGFKYQSDTGVSAWPRSAASVATLYYAGIYRDNAIDKGLDYLVRSAMPESVGRSEAHYFYGMYYTAQTMYLAGGRHWAAWWPAARRELLNRQGAGGTWSDPSVGPAYGTAMALIVLQMPKRYLPIFQK
ncbi:MAG: terpene cyclase/mutase family protein [Phycisphaeraceae bacterium]|nr:terpene cyclase/mutase family protein [Phycisphaeraceae bacterium]